MIHVWSLYGSGSLRTPDNTSSVITHYPALDFLTAGSESRLLKADYWPAKGTLDCSKYTFGLNAVRIHSLQPTAACITSKLAFLH